MSSAHVVLRYERYTLDMSKIIKFIKAEKPYNSTLKDCANKSNLAELYYCLVGLVPTESRIDNCISDLLRSAKNYNRKMGLNGMMLDDLRKPLESSSKGIVYMALSNACNDLAERGYGQK